MKLKRIVSIPIFSVIFMVGFVYYVTVFIFIEDCSGLNSSAGSRDAMIFTLLAFLFLFSFFVCVLSDPGGVPSGFVPDVEQNLVSSDQILILNCALQKDQDFSGRTPLKIFYITSGLMILGLTLTLGTLLIWHIYLMSHNMTTIEYSDRKRAAWLAKKSGLSHHHPFDVGALKNFTLVLGPNMLKWLWPTAISHIKDGLSFPTARDNS